MLRRAIFLTIAVWAAAAGAAVVRDIPYASVNGKFGLGDLYLPEKVSPKTPVVLAIHGGGWGAGDRYSWSGVADFFCRDLGCVAFNIEYRLASAKNRWPACGDDCIKAANWLFSDAFRERTGFSPKSIYICGGSAGGHLALWTLTHLPAGDVAGCVSISAIGDPVLDHAVHAGRYRALFGDAARSASAAIREGLTGHCIWIPDSKPHRLIPEIETRIATFMKNEKLKKGEKQFKACQAKQDRVAIDWMRFESRFDITRNN